MFFNLTLISRALSRDKFLKKIMKKGRKFQKELKVYDYSEHDALLAAVPYYRYKLRTKILRPKSDKDSGAGFDVWDFINDVLAGEHDVTWKYPRKISPGLFWGAPRMLRGVDLLSYYVVTAAAWRHDKTYRSIKKIMKKNIKQMSSKRPGNAPFNKRNLKFSENLVHHSCMLPSGTNLKASRTTSLKKTYLELKRFF